MYNLIRLGGMMFLLCLSTLTARELYDSTGCSQGKGLFVTIIYDNYQADERLDTDWGFACLVECAGERMLFDAGREAELYKQNMELLQIDPREIPSLFISHEHGDHTAGIPWIIQVHPSMKCYLPSTFAAQLRSRGSLPPNSQGISEPLHLYGPFYSTGDDFERFNEQGLVIRCGEGGALITGCGHPGVVAMVEKAEDELGIEIHTVIGGLHLMSCSKKELATISKRLKELGVKKICPTHCTGDNAIACLKEAFGEGYIPGGTGREILIQPE